MSASDWSRKTARLRHMERRVRLGGYPTPEEISEVLRHALTETVRDSLPIGVGLVGFIAGILDGSLQRPRGRPRLDGWEVEERWERALALTREVELRREELRRTKVRQPKATAIDQVAREHHMASDTLRSLVYRGPANNPSPWPWKKEVQQYMQDMEKKVGKKMQ